MNDSTVAPACPGCHFRCALDTYKCGRGKGFSKVWREGKPVPERGVGSMSPGNGGLRDSGARSADRNRGSRVNGGAANGQQPLGSRVMHGLNIMVKVLRDRHGEAAERKILMAVGRQGGFFALDMLPKRAVIDVEAMNRAVDVLIEAGFVVREHEEVAGDILRITDAGKVQQAEWNAEREAATAEFLSPLSEDEQAQLADMLFRLIHANRRKQQ